MKIIDCDWKKRNGNGHSTCHLCNKLTWDSFCYDFELKILDKELFNTVLCDDCISKIRQELECKMVSNEKIIEEVEEKEYEDIDFLGKQDLYVDDARGYSVNIEKIGDKINTLIRNQKKIIEVLNDKDKDN